MKHLLITFIMLVGITATSQHQKTHQLNIKESVIHWTGSYTFFFSEHNGTVQFKSGQLLTQDNSVIGGSFVIDMTTISNEEYLENIGPVKHIRDSDFFDVTKYPEATLVITSVTYYEDTNTHKVLADLTIKGITKEIKFYPTIDGTTKTLKTEFKIDRTRWGITYNNRLKNDAISDAIAFVVTLQF